MICTYPELGPLVADWDRLALAAGNPFMTHAWLSCSWSASCRREPIWLLNRDANGSILAGTFLQRMPRGRLVSPSDAHNGAWDVLARDECARAELLAALAQLGATRIQLRDMRQGAEGTRSACPELERVGYRVLLVPGPFSPWLELPPTWEELLSSLGSGLRAQVRRRSRMLAREGSLVFRTVTGGPTLEEDLERFLKLEASGWKGRSGTAILSLPSTERFYRSYAQAAAERGWLRLNLLELDGALIAGSYDCAFAGVGFLLKTSFSEAHGRLSPGLVLLAEVLQARIREGHVGYDFLGEPDRYKRRWTPLERPRLKIWAYRGAARPGYLIRKRVRPLYRAVRDRAEGVKQVGSDVREREKLAEQH